MTQLMDIVIATSNEGKVKEMIKAFEGLPVRVTPLSRLREILPDFQAVPEPVEDGDSFVSNALIKARYYHKFTGLTTLADDSGLVVPALGGEPGIYSARYAGEHGDDRANNDKLINKLIAVGGEEWSCSYQCALALVMLDGKEFFTEGIAEGIIRNDPRGTGGFGYDPYFYTAVGKTMAELNLAEKDAISHRGAALHLMCDNLAAELGC